MMQMFLRVFYGEIYDLLQKVWEMARKPPKTG